MGASNAAEPLLSSRVPHLDLVPPSVGVLQIYKPEVYAYGDLWAGCGRIRELAQQSGLSHRRLPDEAYLE